MSETAPALQSVQDRRPAGESADVIVVGAGPSGSTVAYYLAQAGLDVLLLEKTAFPREKVCGDGLTPRAVKQLTAMGVSLDDKAWIRNHGLRIIGGGVRIELPWPELGEFPDFGLVRTRHDFDQILAERAVSAGARLLQRTNVTGPVIDPRGNRIVGVNAKDPDGEPVTYRAPLVVAADGNSSRLSVAMGIRKRDDRPMGVAVRTYFTSPRHDDDYLESWLELWDRTEGRDVLLPGYGWVFGVGDGTSNVGLGILNSTASFRDVDYRALLRRWTESMPAEWGFTQDNQQGAIRGAALPMGFNRTPHYTRGLLLVGDAGGMINPFNGEGIAYAMEAGHIAADVIVQAHARPTQQTRERTLLRYPRILSETYGGYYTLGRYFVKMIGQPEFMKYATKYGLPQRTLMRFTLKMLANLTEPTRGDAMDRVINGLSRIAPAA
ncbi:geranylgeranyl reductase family protein [Streptomonospora nanhaiensis]|uniref:Geranylgeranyl reductase family protein n=1 Tax=Streptomonospora nanhaiensis TaxID=1323731 RepID=A0A853BPE7_9ACTN|nr:geranylgeranyl reductase family protein [Streptomonospora nanhaiensis]MBV2361791.1 geranylgeranyl reductase family protein [Streptomonospora nanhaiensis]MBX9387997.1 geranylgeranyl reductase family protein [Streptomonospora nanhaiensis]NYI96391.1 geranylgeranyl reductase family protein [Streptomonospora nanhaiensis]